MRIREIFRGEHSSDAALQAGDAQHTLFGHLRFRLPHTVLDEVVFMVSASVAIHAIPLALGLVQNQTPFNGRRGILRTGRRAAQPILGLRPGW